MNNVLVLEDDLSNLRIFTAILRSKEYNVLKAVTPRAAFATRKLHSKLDLFVCEVSLTADNLSGIEVAVTLARRHEHLPVVLVTATPLSSWSDVDRGKMRRLLSSGVEVLKKPILPRVFEDAVDHLLTRATRNHTPRFTGTAREG
jgi:CheY-like chemotaxis protein